MGLLARNFSLFFVIRKLNKKEPQVQHHNLLVLPLYKLKKDEKKTGYLIDEPADRLW